MSQTAKIQVISINDMLLDSENPRYLDIQENQQESINEMIRRQGNKLIDMMVHIVENGLNPAENIIVIPHGSLDKYIVVEGNRRTTSLKLLNDSSLGSSEMTKGQLGKLQELSSIFSTRPITELNCVVYDSYENARPWIELRHNGLDKGKGVDQWGAAEKDRFRLRKTNIKSFSQLVIDHFINNNTIPPDAYKKIRKSNLDRIIEKVRVKKLLNYSEEENNLIILDDGFLFDTIIGNIIKKLYENKIGARNDNSFYGEADILRSIYELILPEVQEVLTKEKQKRINEYFRLALPEINESLKLKLGAPIKFPAVNEEKSSSESTDPTETANFSEEKSSGHSSRDPSESQPSSDNSGGQAGGDSSSSQAGRDSSSSQSDNQNIQQDTVDPENEEEEEEDRILEQIDRTYADIFRSIKSLVNESKIEENLKKIIKRDITEALRAFDAKAWKACIAMIGTTLEGVMLGTLLRPDVLAEVLRNRSSKTLGKINLFNASIIDHRSFIIEKISFEVLRLWIGEIIPPTRNFDAIKIQQFRNLIHPAVSLQNINTPVNQIRAVNLLSGCKLNVEVILNYEP
jgi:hypothetical protein